jgi:glutamine synthetase type III
MIPVVVGAAVGLAVAGIITSWWNQSGQIRERWDSSYLDLIRTIEEHEENINQHINRINESCSFYELTDLHYSSYKVADEAYRLKQDAEHSIYTQHVAINKITAAIDLLYDRMRNLQNRDEKDILQKEIEDTLDLKKQLYSDLSSLKDQYNDYKGKVKHFNSITSSIKFAIRDHCGQQGKEWYNRLQERIQNRRSY